MLFIGTFGEGQPPITSGPPQGTTSHPKDSPGREVVDQRVDQCCPFTVNSEVPKLTITLDVGG